MFTSFTYGITSKATHVHVLCICKGSLTCSCCTAWKSAVNATVTVPTDFVAVVWNDKGSGQIWLQVGYITCCHAYHEHEQLDWKWTVIEDNTDQTKWPDRPVFHYHGWVCTASCQSTQLALWWAGESWCTLNRRFCLIQFFPNGFISLWILDSLLLGQQWQLLLIEI